MRVTCEACGMFMLMVIMMVMIMMTDRRKCNMNLKLFLAVRPFVCRQVCQGPVFEEDRVNMCLYEHAFIVNYMLINLEMVDLPEEVHADLALVDNVHLLK